MIWRALKASVVTLGIPLLVVFLAFIGVVSIMVVFGWIGGFGLRLLFPFGGC